MVQHKFGLTKFVPCIFKHSHMETIWDVLRWVFWVVVKSLQVVWKLIKLTTMLNVFVVVCHGHLHLWRMYNNRNNNNNYCHYIVFVLFSKESSFFRRGVGPEESPMSMNVKSPGPPFLFGVKKCDPPQEAVKCIVTRFFVVSNFC